MRASDAPRPRVVAAVQARTGSQRLPAKVLADVGGQPLLGRLLGRLTGARRVDVLCVVTSVTPADDRVAALAESLELPCVRGSEENVLSRYLVTAQRFEADVIVRLTGDNPFVDSELLDRAIEQHIERSADYTAASTEAGFPLGISVEVIERTALEAIAAAVDSAEDREHVTSYIRRHPESFRLETIDQEPDLSQVRLTVDVEEDLWLTRRVFRFFAGRNFSWRDAADAVAGHPEWRLPATP